MAEALRDESASASVLYWQGRIAYVRGNLSDALALAEQSLAIADRLKDETLSAPPTNLLGRIYTARWDVARGSQLMAQSAVNMHRIGNRVEEATAAGFACMAFALHGKPAQAGPYGDRAVALAGELTDPFAEAAALQYRGTAYDQQGDWSRAMVDFDTARRAAEAAGDHFRLYMVNLFQGWSHCKAGNPGPGRVLVEHGLGLAEKIGTAFLFALGKAFLVECAVALREDDAPALCRDALIEAEKASDRFAQLVAYRSLAEALMQGGAAPDRAQAEDAMGESIRLSKEIEFNPELARTYVNYARLLQGWGREEQAKSYLAQAIAMFQAMAMTWDLARAEHVLAAIHDDGSRTEAARSAAAGFRLPEE
jgi:tetratricopeptide (TPR) repeat protein